MPPGARTVLPFMAIPATAIWDAFFAHLSISEAKLRGVGFATAIEVFNKIADAQLAEEEDKDDYTPQNDFSINLVRSIGGESDRYLCACLDLATQHTLTWCCWQRSSPKMDHSTPPKRPFCAMP
jgi:hypothetical protein